LFSNSFDSFLPPVGSSKDQFVDDVLDIDHIAVGNAISLDIPVRKSLRVIYFHRVGLF